MKVIELEGIGPVKLVKSRSARSIKLSVNASGSVRVSMPSWTPYAIGAAFAEKNQSWLSKELSKRINQSFEPGQKIGKLHKLYFETVTFEQAATTRVTATKIIIKIHPNEDISGVKVQERANRAVLKALKKETEQLLPTRTQILASKHGFSYRNVSAKQLKRRWGSCDNNCDIVFNLFLMQLPWELIDYVILHELTHTQHLHHGTEFWTRLKEVCPRALDLRKQIRAYYPTIS